MGVMEKAIKGVKKGVKITFCPILLQLISLLFADGTLEGFIAFSSFWVLAGSWLYSNIQHYIRGLSWNDTFLFGSDVEGAYEAESDED